MVARVSPTEPKPTHHLKLTDRAGDTLALILCDETGAPLKDYAKAFSKRPVETTAMKQTSGGSSYDDYDYPYSPIVKSDFIGGRGNLLHEKDTTKYYDGYRARVIEGRVFAGPQEVYTNYASQGHEPGSITYQPLVKKTAVPGEAHVFTFENLKVYCLLTYTGSPTNLTLYAGKYGRPTSGITINIYTNSSGTLGTLTQTYSGLEPVNGIVNVDVTLPSGQCWLVISGGHQEDYYAVGVGGTGGSTYVSTSTYTTPVDTTPMTAPSTSIAALYYRLRTTGQGYGESIIPFQYKGSQYFTAWLNTAAHIYRVGDRGTADANTGALTTLIDATKSWETNVYAGKVVEIVYGTGRTEATTWRTIVSNTATTLTVDSAWTIEHDTTTEYVIHDTSVTEITGHGLTAKVTDVLVTTAGYVLFAQGDAVNIRRWKAETVTGVWTNTYADDGTNKATLLDYIPGQNKIVKTNNKDANGNVSVATATPATTWANMTFSAVTNVDSKYIPITGTAVYTDDAGDEALWIFKEDLPYILTVNGSLKPFSLEEMRTLRNPNNGRTSFTHGLYLYFTLGNGLQRYYQGSLDDVGPNRGEGLPTERKGFISAVVPYPPKFFVAIDAGSAGYSSVMDSDGYHERYRAPLGKRITGMMHQVIPGTEPDRLWLVQGDEVVYLPMPSDTLNELQDSAYRYTNEFTLTLSKMHAGLYDVTKIVNRISIHSENLAAGVCTFEVDYRLDAAEAWTNIGVTFDTSPVQEVDFTDVYGLAFKSIQLRIRGYSTDNTKTPILNNVIVNAVLRTDVKYMYGPFQVRIMDAEETLQPEELDDITSATEKLQRLEDWADASTDSLLYMESLSPVINGRMVFMNTPQTRQVIHKGADGNPYKKDVMITTITLQEA